MLQSSEIRAGGLKESDATADMGFMDVKTVVQKTAPTPFGWVISAQKEFDLEAILGFQGQLVALSRAFEPAIPVTAKAFAGEPVETVLEQDALDRLLECVPVPVRAA